MKIAFLGDIAIDSEVRVDPEVSRFLNGADVVIANLEGVILKKGAARSAYKTYGSIVHNDHDAVMKLIETIGITHVNLYNNHMIDYGELQLENTVNVLSKSGIKILGQENYLSFDGESITLNNSGLVETFGIYEAANAFGQNANEMLFETDPAAKWSGCIMHTHFGIEQVKGLSEYESKWFDYITKYRPRLIIRHHPHSVQEPFEQNGVPCFPSIGDFAFNFKRKKISNGLAVIFNTVDSVIDCRTVECSDYCLSVGLYRENFLGRKGPEILSSIEREQLRERYRKEYREDGKRSLKKAIKYFLGIEKSEHVLSMSSTHFIQPYILGEIL